MNKPTLANLKSLPYGGAHYVISPQNEEFVKSAIAKSAQNNCLGDNSIREKFLTAYRTWIQSSGLNTVSGIDQYPVMAFSSGTTEAFDKFYLKNRNRRLRYFKGEYMYHQVAGRQYFDRKSAFIEDADLDVDDAVVISLPFSDTGDQHHNMSQVLSRCNELGIPVLLDCAYFGICAGIHFDLDYSCITDVTFSLSKTFAVPHLRIGMRLTRTDDDDALLVMNKTDYVNRLSCAVGLELIENFSPDLIYLQYQSAQKKMCSELEVDPSHSVIFGIDRNNRYPEYNRGGITNRLCLSKYLDNALQNSK